MLARIQGAAEKTLSERQARAALTQCRVAAQQVPAVVQHGDTLLRLADHLTGIA